MEFLNPNHHVVNCETGSVEVEMHSADHMADWKNHVHSVNAERQELEAKVERKARALELIKGHAGKDPLFAALLELVT